MYMWLVDNLGWILYGGAMIWCLKKVWGGKDA